MKLTKYLLAALLLITSGQASALFMPAGFKVNTEAVVTAPADGGC